MLTNGYLTGITAWIVTIRIRLYYRFVLLAMISTERRKPMPKQHPVIDTDQNRRAGRTICISKEPSYARNLTLRVVFRNFEPVSFRLPACK